MTNILTVDQAANALRVATNDARMTDLLDQVDSFIERATGRDWTQDNTIEPVAIAAATMLIVMWFDNPSMIGSDGSLPFGLTNALSQLEAEALKYRKYQFYGLSSAGGVGIWEARVGDQVVSLTGIYGVSGDQSSKFESTVSLDHALQQTSTEDLSDYIYVVILKSPAEDIVP